MNNIRLLRTIVVLSMSAYIAWYFEYLYWSFYLSPSEIDLENYGYSYGTIIPEDNIFINPDLWLAVSLIAYGGILFLKNWGRYLFVLLYIIWIPLSLFCGFTVASPVGSALSTLYTLLDGMIIGITFFSSASDSFKNKIIASN